MPQEKSVRVVNLFSFVSEPQLTANEPALHASEHAPDFCADVMVPENAPVERHAANCAISLLVHGAVIAVLLILPLFSSSAPRMAPWMRDMVVIPLPPARKTVVVRRSPSVLAVKIFSSAPPATPDFSARRVAMDPPIPFSSLTANAMAANLGGGSVLGGIVASAPARVVAPVLPETLRVVHLGGEVTSTRPLDRLTLAYPQLAKAAHVFGKVVIRAIIDESGRVINARAISGPALLYAAAVEAVSKERFKPMLLNGEPTRCDLQVQVSFNLSDF
ncbi:MAG TPA: energy transducer TonB [Candidatus Acidoferrales bacterium]|jgi:protein TonB|nr:energy transducer TonB [Candidatus Acidoferrales bacterium]